MRDLLEGVEKKGGSLPIPRPLHTRFDFSLGGFGLLRSEFVVSGVVLGDVRSAFGSVMLSHISGGHAGRVFGVFPSFFAFVPD